MQTKGSILSVILVQARHYAKGEVTIKPDFANLKDSLCRKDADFMYAMLPHELVNPSKKRKADEAPEPAPATPQVQPWPNSKVQTIPTRGMRSSNEFSDQHWKWAQIRRSHESAHFAIYI